jgi:cytochrome c oxidase subunit 4
MENEIPQNIPSVTTYLIVWACLMALLILTVIAAMFDLGTWSVVIALVIAGLKALLVITFFMHLKYGTKQTWFFAFAGLLWLAIMLILTLADYITRGWLIRA